MKTFLFLISFFLGTITFAQNNCSCTSDLDYVIQYYEENLPAFETDITKDNIDEYDNLKKQVYNESLQITNKVACFKLLLLYVEYFRDNHSTIRMNFPQINENNQDDITEFLSSEIYQATEIYQLSEEDKKEYPISEIRGIYQSESGVYTIAVLPSKTNFRDYVGVVIDSKSKLWKKGQVKLELKTKKNGEFEAFVYLNNHSIKHSSRYPFYNGVLGSNWFKTNLKSKKNYAVNLDDTFDFHLINDSTTYLRLPTFDAGYTTVFDSIYALADPIIRKTPYLLIDVRNNDGGSYTNVEPLVDYTYTNPIIKDYMELYATEGNLKVWEQWYGYMLEDKANYEQVIPEIKSRIDKIKAVDWPSFIPLSEGEDTTVLDVIPFPKKVAILFDRGCASSCELLLFGAKQSSKTILVGENSGGYVGYGENGSVQTPCYQFTLNCTMTRFHSQRKFEVIGIPPEYQLDYNKDWLLQTIDILLEE